MRHSKLLAVIVLVCGVYAVTRYHIFGGTSIAHFPVFVMNKIVSWVGLIVFGLAIVEKEKQFRGRLGTISFVLIATHAVLSLFVLQPAYHANLFLENGRMTGNAESSMLAGIAGLVLMSFLLVATLSASEEWKNKVFARGLGRVVLVLTAAHVALMGFANWFRPADWYGYMPPITLFSFLTAVVFLVWRFRNGIR